MKVFYSLIIVDKLVSYHSRRRKPDLGPYARFLCGFFNLK